MEFEVLSKTHNKDGTVTVKASEDFSKQIPIWMTEPQAAYHHISKNTEINLKSILSLIELLECSIENLKF